MADGPDSTASSTESKGPVAVFIKKKKGGGTRKRKGDTVLSNIDEDEDTVVEKREKQTRGIEATTKQKAKRDEGHVTVTYQSTRTADFEGPRDQGATAEVNIDTETDRDAQAIFERAQQLNAEGVSDDVYRGIAGYRQYKSRKETVAGSAFKGLTAKGPMRAPANIRSTVRWDYQPDICKDYKETGYCGFGDTCKFLHDRSDYKHGWQIDQEIERGEYNSVDVRQYQIEQESDEEDQLPFACFICREPFTNPVVTKCKHYFCEKCLLEHFKTSMNCFVCNEKTGGLFQPAKDIIKRQKELAEQQAADGNSSDS